jgi:hypothetical protein
MNRGKSMRSDEVGEALANAGRVAVASSVLAIAIACASDDTGRRSEVATDTMTNALVRLRTEQLTSNDVYGVEVAINCEMQRLMSNVGYDSFAVLMRVADRRVNRVATSAQRRRIDQFMALKAIGVGAGCDSLARAGRLGGPYLALPYDSLPGVLNK